MMITSLLKKLLLVTGYPRLLTFRGAKQQQQQYQQQQQQDCAVVGAIQVRIPHSVQAQIFYPTRNSVADHDDDDHDDDKRPISSSSSSSPSSSRPYFRPEAVQGLIEYMQGLGDGIVQFLTETPHPCRWQADPPAVAVVDGAAGASATGAGAAAVMAHTRYPLVLFSHGLAGTCELYTQLCSLLASYGFVVVAVEHEDGSAAYATKNDERGSGGGGDDDDDGDVTTPTVIPYKRPNDEPYSRQKVLTLRTPMLKQRVQELEDVLSYFQNPTANANHASAGSIESTASSINGDGGGSNNINNRSEEILHQLANQCIDTTKVHLVGHSFGGATQIMATQKWTETAAIMDSTQKAKAETSTSASSISSNTNPDRFMLPPQSITLLDPWAFSLEDHVLETGLDTRQGAMPVLCVLSEAWTSPQHFETQQIVQCLQSTLRRQREQQQGRITTTTPTPTVSALHSYYAKHSVHQSFSDAEAWFPTWVARRVYNCGPKEERHATVRAVANAWKEHLAVPKASRTTVHTQNQNSRLGKIDGVGENSKESVLVPFEIPFPDKEGMTKGKLVLVATATTSSMSS